MFIIYILIFFSIGIAASFLVAFLWAVRDGQFDDEFQDGLWPDNPNAKAL